MIARLLKLELEGFRCFANRQEISLDGDVVLIHGSNGSGKTSLLSAIELALTGAISELRVFESDYPRCLRNVATTSEGFVRLCFRTQDGSEITANEDLYALFRAHGALSEADAAFFRDRCYLSQTSLSRLLENYQACSDDDPEQPLVRFVRELLGLDLLENITSGLYEAALINRLEKNIPSLAHIRDESRALQQKLQELQADQTTKFAMWQQALINVQKLTAKSGDPLPEAPWTPEGVIARADSYTKGGRESGVSDALKKVRLAEGRLQHALGRLGPARIITTARSIKARLDKIALQKTEIERTVAPLLDRAQSILLELGISAGQLTDDLAARAEEIEAALKAGRAARATRSQILANSEKELTTIQKRRAVVEKELAKLGGRVHKRDESSQSLSEVLAAALNYLKSEDCPVCGRDYSEVGGNLREHIVSEIARLGADAKKLEQISERRHALMAESTELSQRTTALSERIRIERERGVLEGKHDAAMDTAIAEIAALSKSLDQWRKLRGTIDDLSAQLRAAEAQDKERREAAAEIESVFADIGAPRDVRKEEPRAFGIALADVARARAEKLEVQTADIAKYQETLSRAVSEGVAWQKAEQAFTSASKRLERLHKALSRVDQDIASARYLSKAATSAKTRTLNQVFNEKLNGLWRQLFRRLVKNERFQPQLRDPKSIRGQIRTSIGAWRVGVDPFEQFASVASSGNLNTAALSLFLSLHLVEAPRHCLLVLDDPIQNMDDLHVVQLANLLRQIRQKARRQLILAVHERALFEYLRLELGPTATQATLLTLELERKETNEDLTIRSVFYPSTPDKVRFDRSVAATVPNG